MGEETAKGRAAAAAGRGLVAGIAGTTAMTASQAIEARITGRKDSTVPAQVGSKLLGVRPRSKAGRARLNSAVHWGHGASMGVVRGLMSITGARGPSAAAAYFAALWGGDCALYVALGVAPPPWRWSAGELATDVFHKALLAGVTSFVYDALDSTSGGDPAP